MAIYFYTFKKDETMLRDLFKKLYTLDYEQSYKSMLSVCDLFYNE